MCRIDNRFATDRLPARTVGDHDSCRRPGRVSQNVGHITAVEELDVVVDQLVFQRFLYMKRSRETFPRKEFACKCRLRFFPFLPFVEMRAAYVFT